MKNEQFSPILPVQYGKGYILQKSGMGLSIAIKPIDYNNCFPIKNINEAEDLFLSKAHNASEIYGPEEKKREHDLIVGDLNRLCDKSFWMTCATRRQCSYVAKRGRRGYANIALMNPNMLLKIGMINLVTCSEYFQGFGDKLGRWTKMAEIPKSDYLGSTVYCSAHLPDNEIYVLYKGNNLWCDSGGLVLIGEFNQKGVYLQPETDITGVSQYVTRIIFEGI